MSEITDKRIVITGANSGIGLEVLRILAGKSDNTILAVDRNTDVLEGMGGNVHPMKCDVSSPEGVDEIFAEAERSMGGIDIFYANAGFSYYEEMNYTDWNRVENIFRTNVFSPIYSYQKFVRHLNGRDGMFAITGSAMGCMGMPGFTLYTASKFAINGFQDAVNLEKADNVHIISLYPVSTDTGFFRTATDIDIRKPYPMQTPDVVAKRMVRGMEKGKKKVFPCRMFRFAMVLFKILPFTKTMYLNAEKKKFEDYKSKRDALKGR